MVLLSVGKSLAPCFTLHLSKLVFVGLSATYRHFTVLFKKLWNSLPDYQLLINFKIKDLTCEMLILQAALFNFSLSETTLTFLVSAVYWVGTKSFQGFGNGLGHNKVLQDRWSHSDLCSDGALSSLV